MIDGTFAPGQMPTLMLGHEPSHSSCLWSKTRLNVLVEGLRHLILSMTMGQAWC